MKASVLWLRELLPELTLPASEIAARLTHAGLEVEGIELYGEACAQCILVEVLALEPHPTKSGLRLVTLNTGAAGTQRVVCGASNVPDPGGMVVLAPLGTVLPAVGMTMEPRAIGGVESCGMLCSERELGLSDESEGILVFAAGFAAPGTPFAVALPESCDTVLELNVTPNRPDALGHRGLARELAAICNFVYDAPKADSTRQSPCDLKIVIEDGARCQSFGIATVSGAKVGPSGLGAQYRLRKLGVRPISNMVDITNLVMLEFGHPMHAFDRAKLGGDTITVRQATAGEALVGLDKVTRELTVDDTVVASAHGALSLAGVMGGEPSGVSDATTEVVFEVANFASSAVRRSSKRHGLHTESSHRFERGVDPTDVAEVMARATQLAAEMAGARVTCALCNHVKQAYQAPTVRLREARVTALVGSAIPWADAVASLKRLGFEIASEQPGEVSVRVPGHRPDVRREEDLVEEVVRLYGIDKVPAALPAVPPTRDVGTSETQTSAYVAAGVQLGLSEALTYTLTSEASLRNVHNAHDVVKLQNPLSEVQSVLRTSLVPGLLDALAHARRHGQSDVRMQTCGPTFHAQEGVAPEGAPLERRMWTALIAGGAPGHLSKRRAFDVWDMKAIAEGMARSISGRTLDLITSALPTHLHPRGGAWLHIDEVCVGWMGPLHPDVLGAWNIEDEAFVVEFDTAKLSAARSTQTRYKAPAKFPGSERDMALLVADTVRAGEVCAVVREHAGPLCADVSVFDKFTGETLGAGNMSLGIRVSYKHAERTLTDKEVDEAHAKALAGARQAFGAEQRA